MAITYPAAFPKQIQSTEVRNNKTNVEKTLRNVVLKGNKANRKNNPLVLFMKDPLLEKNHRSLNSLQNQLLLKLYKKTHNKINNNVQ